jgi:hypothetical protein
MLSIGQGEGIVIASARWNQCCESEFGSSWDPHQIERWDPDTHQSVKVDPDPHQSVKVDPDPHQFADDRPKRKKYEPI